MLLSMALRTAEIERLIDEVHRVLLPGGLMVYTVRNTTDAHFGAGASHGDDMFEMGGFIVHFFDRVLISSRRLPSDRRFTSPAKRSLVSRPVTTISVAMYLMHTLSSTCSARQTVGRHARRRPSRAMR